MMNGLNSADLKTNPFFQRFSDQALNDIAAHARHITFTKNQILFINDDVAEFFYIVKNGWVKLYRETIDGTQSMIDILTINQIFGETVIFHNDKYPFTAEAVEDVQTIRFPLSVLKKEIEANASLAMDMMGSMARYRRQQDQEIENLTLKNAPQRIGCFLLRLIDQTQKGSVTIRLPYDKTLVASRLGMQPETFSRALNKLKTEIDIVVEGHNIHITNLQELIDFVCFNCSSEFPCHDL